MNHGLAADPSSVAKIRVDDLDALMIAGIVEEGGRDELIDGKIVRRDGRWANESYLLTTLAMRWRDRAPAVIPALYAYAGVTVAIPPYDAPDAGVALVSRSASGLFFTAGDMALLLDVVRTADKGLRPDRQRLYATAGVPEYWVVDLNMQEVHRFADPHDGAYCAEPPPVPLAGELRRLTMPELAIDGSGIL